ncbi:MAG TPA: hypothetical protein VN041_13975 [Microbacterium sp.]|nr:hypothetical protein [Microbacterium sp.]
MATNIGFDDGHPYFETGADDGKVFIVDGRIAFTDTDATPSTVTVERSDDGGSTWTPVLGETPAEVGAAFMDWQSASYADILYRAIAVNTEGAAAVTTITVEARSLALWLSGGVGFGQTARLPLNPDVTHTTSRDGALKEYAGRDKPVAYRGEMTTRSVAVSGRVTDRKFIQDTVTPDQLLQMALSPEPIFLFRDPDGRRIYGTIGPVNMPRQTTARDDDGMRSWNGFWGYSFTLTEAEEA